VVSLNLCKEYLSVATFKLQCTRLIPDEELNICFLCHRVQKFYTFKMVFFGPPCISNKVRMFSCTRMGRTQQLLMLPWKSLLLRNQKGTCLLDC